jgi:4,5-dihydroxyphthalate decarboxylase
MAKLDLSVTMGDVDRTLALLDGTVQIDGVDPVYIELPARG